MKKEKWPTIEPLKSLKMPPQEAGREEPYVFPKKYLINNLIF